MALRGSFVAVPAEKTLPDAVFGESAQGNSVNCDFSERQSRTASIRTQPNLPFCKLSLGGEGRQLKSSKHEERKQLEFFGEKLDKKERSTKVKEKREKMSEEEKEMRKERKMGRKRDRLDEAVQQELKRRREEEKVAKLMSQNGELIEPPLHPREKHHRTRDISPYPRERSHEKSEPRDKHRRSSENKRR